MRITNLTTDDAVLEELGVRLARVRLDLELTQRELATEAGIGAATVKRLESGRAVGSDTLVRVLRAVGRLGAVEELVPQAVPRPLEQLTAATDRRRRVRHGQRPRPGSASWKWAEPPARDSDGA
jgi:transcriptional regulator with XRE-family HTH domain